MRFAGYDADREPAQVFLRGLIAQPGPREARPFQARILFVSKYPTFLCPSVLDPHNPLTSS